MRGRFRRCIITLDLERLSALRLRSNLLVARDVTTISKLVSDPTSPTTHNVL
jgi:hypothetical protein